VKSEAEIHRNFDIRLATLIADFDPLLSITGYLWSNVEGQRFEVSFWTRIWWLWYQVDAKVKLDEVEARFTELLSYAEK